jgi:PAS domain S-box-containing protein
MSELTSDCTHPASNRSEFDGRFQSIFDAVSDGMFISNPDTGRFIEVNQAACNMFGYDRSELVGCDVDTLSSGTSAHAHERAIELNTKARMGEPQIFEWECKSKDGSLFWTEISLRYTEFGPIPAIVAIVRDIARRKLQDKKLQLALENASHANAAKSAFLASMSHELRTPLNAIIGFSDLMLTQQFGPIGNHRYLEYVGDIHRSGMQLLALIDDLLDLSRIDAGKTELLEQTVSLRRVITDACRMTELQAKESLIHIAIELPNNLPYVCGDERRILQIVLNLLSNAIKFTPRAGTVTIRVFRLASGLALEVTDTGIGIAEVDLPKVFERFGQVDNTLSGKHKGTGLGLPLAKELIELHGGDLSIKSEVSVGTTVTVTFPRERIAKIAEGVAA